MTRNNQESELHEVVRRGRDLAPTTRARYLNDLNQWVQFAGADPKDWTRAKAQDFYEHLLDERKLRPQSANRVMASLQYASKWWAHRHSKPELDFAYVQKEKGKQKIRKEALNQEQVTRLLASLEAGMLKGDPETLRDYAIIVTLLETGMRKMSLVAMTIERTLLEAKGVPHYPLTWVPLKGTRGEEVAIPLSDTAIAAIAPWRAWLVSRGITRGPMFQTCVSRIGPRGLVVTPTKTAMYFDAINRLLDRRSATAGIGHVYPHQFRHTFITWRIAAGLLPHEVAAMTGHTIAGLGAMAGYIDMTVIAEKVRNSTPEWLKALVLK